MMTLQSRREAIEEKIQAALHRSGRGSDRVHIIAVSKGQTASTVIGAAKGGLHIFGENRIQEAIPKMNEVNTYGIDCSWHFIGRLQTNKVRALHDETNLLFDMIHSLDRMSLAEAISKRMSRFGLTQSVLVQVNVANEETKAGIHPLEAEGFLRQVVQLPGIEVQGLMTIAPYVDDPELVRPIFRELSRLRAQLARLRLPRCSMDHLSMGMTGDFEVAVEEGATFVRIGRALFPGR